MGNKTEYIKEYDKFMKWFKINHPLLHGKYWANIVMPVDGSGIGVNDIKIDDNSYDQIVELVFNYYQYYRGQ